MIRRNLPTTLFLLVGVILLTSCMPPTPIAVYMTATHFPTESPLVLATNTPPTQTAEVQFTQIAALPTETPAAAPTETPTAAPTQSPMPNVTWRGPIVGPGYVPPTTPAPEAAPPTETPAPGTPSNTPAPPTNTPEGAPAGAALVLPNLDGNRIGIQLDINLSQDDWRDAMGRIETLGVRWVKVQIAWRDMQPNNRDERGTEFFRRVEQYLEDANRRGFSVMVSIAKAPAWARSNQTEDGPPDNPADLANFITILLQEINPDTMRDVLGDNIDAVEVWNEPNLIREWQGTLPFTGAGYMTLFTPAYQAIRAYSPTLPIITAGLAPTGNSAGSVDDREFLRQMYAAGLASYTDVIIGAHPYSWANAPDAVCCGTRGWDDDPHFFYADTMREYRDIMTASGDADAQIWITEFGYATWDNFPQDPPAGSEWMRFNDRWRQAGYTIRMLQIAQESGYVGPVILWNLNFATLAGLVVNRDERIAYSILIPGEGCNFQENNPNRTERPLFWMIFDAVRADTQLNDWCGQPPSPLPGYGG
ncbi:MAG: cellulase family glycosylhydrolase [bacterium]|nr:cellulase family glycosylhydrolase [bacterium]